MNSYNERKKLRQTIRKQRKELPKYQRTQAANSLCKQIQSLSHYQNSKHIAIYIDNDGEIETQLIIKDILKKGKSCYLPVLHPVNKKTLFFVQHAQKQPLKKNRYGINEPWLKTGRIIPASMIELVLTPLVAVDSKGFRLGMGGGYYDRTFNKNHPSSQQLFGLGYSFQVIDQISSEPWDVPLNGMVTEKGITLIN